jgi:thioredoxin 1
MKQISQSELEQVHSKGKKVVVQYTASWCGPCKALAPKLMNISQFYGNVEFVKVDVQENMELAQSLEIRSVPTVVLYSGNNITSRSTGIQPDDFYKNALNDLTNA